MASTAATFIRTPARPPATPEPTSKIREMDGNMPFEEWVYGEPPHDVTFVRINGNRVIREGEPGNANR